MDARCTAMDAFFVSHTQSTSFGPATTYGPTLEAVWLSARLYEEISPCLERGQGSQKYGSREEDLSGYPT